MAQQVTTPLALQQLAASPASAPNGTIEIYSRTDGLVYQKDQLGNERPVGNPFATAMKWATD